MFFDFYKPLLCSRLSYHFANASQPRSQVIHTPTKRGLPAFFKGGQNDPKPSRLSQKISRRGDAFSTCILEHVMSTIGEDFRLCSGPNLAEDVVKVRGKTEITCAP